MRYSLYARARTLFSLIGGTGMNIFIINQNGNPFLLQDGNPIFAWP